MKLVSIGKNLARITRVRGGEIPKGTSIGAGYWYILLFLLLILIAEPADAYSVKRFESVVNLGTSGDLEIEETIEISFDKKEERHHFYRVIPLSGSIHKGYSSNKEIFVRLLEISSLDDERLLSNSWVAAGSVHIAIGDNDKTLDGKHRFRIRYILHNLVESGKSKDTMLLNCTGDSWLAPIEKLESTIYLPPGAGPSQITLYPYLERSGTLSPAGKVKGESDKFICKMDNLPAGSSFLIGIELPKGVLMPYSILQEISWRLQSLYQMFLLPVFTIIIVSVLWLYRGRDPSHKKSKSAESPSHTHSAWQPPEQLPAVFVGTLADERCDHIDLVSIVFDLAIRGFIKIRALPYNGIFFLSNKDYEFTLLRSPRDAQLKFHEQFFLSTIFGISDKTYLTALKGRFHEYIPYFRALIYDELCEEKLFDRNPQLERRNFVAVGVSVITAGAALLVISVMHVSGKSAAVGTIISGVILLLASSLMPRKSRAGAALAEQIRNFQYYLSFGDKKDLQATARENPELFEKYLSYAIALGLTDKWCRIYKESEAGFPDWFEMHPLLLPDVSVNRSNKSNSEIFVKEIGECLLLVDKSLRSTTTMQTTLYTDRPNPVEEDGFV